MPTVSAWYYPARIGTAIPTRPRHHNAHCVTLCHARIAKAGTNFARAIVCMDKVRSDCIRSHSDCTLARDHTRITLSHFLPPCAGLDRFGMAQGFSRTERLIPSAGLPSEDDRTIAQSP